MGVGDPGAAEGSPHLARHVPDGRDGRRRLRRGGARAAWARRGAQLPRSGRLAHRATRVQLSGRHPRSGCRRGRLAAARPCRRRHCPCRLWISAPAARREQCRRAHHGGQRRRAAGRQQRRRRRSHQYFLDEEALFETPQFLRNMAAGMMMSPPRLSPSSSDDSPDPSEAGGSLWSYRDP